MAKLKVKFWIYMQNNGDGSACAKFFKTEGEAEMAAADDDERYCDDIYPKTITVDTETCELA